jgi:sulfate adenylyltransferase
MKIVPLRINRRQYLELKNVSNRVFAPLTELMGKDAFNSVVETMRLPNSDVFPLPVVLDLTQEQAKEVRHADRLALLFGHDHVGEMTPQEIFNCEKPAVAEKIFGTRDLAHPGVAHFFAMGDQFVGGPVKLNQELTFEFSEYELLPYQTRAHFAAMGWKTVVGFQTRNVPHRAHEYLLRLGLEIADGLFIQPLVGTKRKGDYTPEAILTGYRTLIDGFLPPDKVLLGVLSTAMRYAGPREAIFHSIIRRNYGCTHFIVGRDHAGVGSYYGLYEAHDLTRQFEDELGIQILRFAGPFYCKLCDGIATERSCPHISSAPQATRQISGTEVRSILLHENGCPPELMRPEVVAGLQGLELFITENAE